MNYPRSQLQFVEKSQIPRGFHLLAPLSGSVCPFYEALPELLVNGIAGEGIALLLSGNKIVAPFDGTVMEITGSLHRLQLKAKNGIKILILMPQGTQSLYGQGMIAQVKTNQQIYQGQVLATYNPQLIHSQTSNISSITITNPEQLGSIYCAARKVTAGEDILLTICAKKTTN